MNQLILKIFFCIGIVGITLYSIIYKQNALTELRLQIPTLSRDLKNLEEENRRYRFEIDTFESPAHLFELMRKPEFSHLKEPSINEVIQIKKKRPSDAE